MCVLDATRLKISAVQYLEYIHKCCETGIQNFFKRKKNTQRLLSFFVCLCACKGSLASASAKLELAKKCPEYLGHLSIIPLMRHAQCRFWHLLDISIFPYFANEAFAHG